VKNHIIISLLFLSVGFCQQNKTDQPNPYKGVRIKKILEFTYQPKFDDYIEIPTNDSIVVTYNTLGFKIDSTTYRNLEDSSKYNEYLDEFFYGIFNNHYEYDIGGHLTKQIDSHNHKGLIKSYYGIKNEYDENGLKVKVTDFTFDEKIKSIWLYKYDKNNNLVDQTKYNSKGELWENLFVDSVSSSLDSLLEHDFGGGSKIILKYDTKDRLIEKVGYNYDGNKLWVEKYEYDQLKKIVTGIIVGKRENDTTKTIYIYDEKGNLLETKETRSGYGKFIFTNEINKYDSNGRLIQKRQPRFYRSRGLSWWEYEYDEQGKLILIKEGSVKNKFEKINFIPRNKKIFKYDYY